MSLPAGYTPRYGEFQPQLDENLFVGILKSNDALNTNNIMSRDYAGNVGTWVDYPTDKDIIITWKCFDKSDINPENHINFRAGFYLSYFVIQVSSEPSFTDTTLMTLNVQVPSHHPHSKENYFVLYNDMPDAGTGTIQNYSHTIPKGTLKAARQYYFRIVPLFFVGVVVDHDDSNILIPTTGIISAFPSPEATTAFGIKTVDNLPIITFNAKPDNFLTEFGGVTTLTWAVDENGGTLQNVFIKPLDIPGLGRVQFNNTSPGLNIDVESTTTFTLEATNENGTSRESVEVKVAAQEGIKPIFDSRDLFPMSQLIEGDLTAVVGQTFHLELYTEYMRDVHLFVAYPFANGNVEFTKISVNPPDLIKNLVDESTVVVPITVPYPRQPIPFGYFVSGAWGYDSVGKDGKFWNEVSGYFKLIGNSASLG
jgi:hypothetical protein